MGRSASRAAAAVVVVGKELLSFGGIFCLTKFSDYMASDGVPVFN